jgi:hypothetical protein
METFNLDTLKNAIDEVDNTKPNSRADISGIDVEDITKRIADNPLKKWIKCIYTDTTVPIVNIRAPNYFIALHQLHWIPKHIPVARAIKLKNEIH